MNLDPTHMTQKPEIGYRGDLVRKMLVESMRPGILISKTHRVIW